MSTDKHPNSHRCKQAWIYLARKYVNTAGFYSIGSTCKKAGEIAYCSVKTRSKCGFDCFYFGLYLPQHAEGISTQLKQKIREQPTILHYKYNCISIRPESKIILWDKEWNCREIAFFWCLANIIWCMKWRNVTKEGTLEKIKICFACYYKFGCFSKRKILSAMEREAETLDFRSVSWSVRSMKTKVSGALPQTFYSTLSM